MRNSRCYISIVNVLKVLADQNSIPNDAKNVTEGSTEKVKRNPNEMYTKTHECVYIYIDISANSSDNSTIHDYNYASLSCVYAYLRTIIHLLYLYLYFICAEIEIDRE